MPGMEKLMKTERMWLLLVIWVMFNHGKALKEEKVTSEEGSCVTFQCTFNTQQISGIVERIIWLKNPVYSQDKKDYEGSVVYQRNLSQTSPEVTRRFEDVGKPTLTNGTFQYCSLKINELQLNDTAFYGFRYYTKGDKWLHMNVSLQVEENPCSISIVQTATIVEGKHVSLVCTSKAKCDETPMWTSTEDLENSQQSDKTDTDERRVTELAFTPSWKDHQKILSCEPPNKKDECEVRSITLDIQFAPKDVKVKSESEEKMILENKELKLLCAVEAANPAVTDYYWYKDGVLSQRNISIHFEKVTRLNSGTYLCVALNKQGNGTSDAFKLDVLYKPEDAKINLSKPIESLVEGVDLDMNCTFTTGNPRLSTFTWYKNEEVLNETGQTLSVKNITFKNDQEMYKCAVQNDAGNNKSEGITIILEYPPKETIVIVKPENVKEGDIINLTCTSKANPPVSSYTWFKIGGGVLSTSSAVHSFSQITIEDKGRYCCQVTNKLGTVNSTEVVIDVKYAPKGVTIKRPFEGAIHEGRDVTFKCNVQGSNPPEFGFAWYKDSMKTSTKGKDLHFQSISYTDAGSYCCEASNSVGSMKSEEIRIDVLYGPLRPTIQTNPSNGKVKVGYRIKFTCKTQANPAPNYYWYKKDSKSTVRLEPKSQVMDLVKVTVKDAGKYHCSAENEYNAQNSSSIEVEVLYPPFKPTLTIPSDVIQGSRTTIVCSVQSHPVSELKLTTIKHSVIKTTNSIEVTFIAEVNDTGPVTCTAKNTEGTSERTEKLLVKYPPTIPSVVASTSDIRENKYLDLRCNSQGYPPITHYSWFKVTEGKDKTMGNGNPLKFNHVSYTDSGSYYCSVKNDIGESNSTVTTFNVKYAPKSIKIVHNHSNPYTDGNVWMMCSCESYPPVIEYSWYTISQQFEETYISSNQNLTVHSADPFMYYCSARNEISREESIRIRLPMKRGLSQMNIILLVILSLILIILLTFCLIHRRRKRKATQGGVRDKDMCLKLLGYVGARNNTRENLVLEGMSESQRSREDLTEGIHNPQFALHSHVPNLPRPGRCSEVTTIYSTVKTAVAQKGLDEGGKRECLNGDAGQTGCEETLNYAYLDFHGKHQPNGKEDNFNLREGDGAIYAKVNRTSQKKQGKGDYENMQGGKVAKRKESEEEDEIEGIHYSSIVLPKTLPSSSLEWESEPDSDEEDYTTQYSKVKT
ncbi:B-cell receptor CD22 [Amia ocellicauda]|uniref:B-cell receptor CD22 n=1 Tax=Amia ocellicauda TaxID=2972642 RepID=UPI003463F52B